MNQKLPLEPFLNVLQQCGLEAALCQIELLQRVGSQDNVSRAVVPKALGVMLRRKVVLEDANLGSRELRADRQEACQERGLAQVGVLVEHAGEEKGRNVVGWLESANEGRED